MRSLVADVPPQNSSDRTRVGLPLKLLVVALIAVTSSCGSSSDDTADGSTPAASGDTTSTSAATSAATSASGSGKAASKALADDTVCGRFTASIPAVGDWEANYSTPDGESAGYDDQPSEGSTNFDLGLACGASNGRTAGLGAVVNRIVDERKWDEFLLAQLSGTECHSVALVAPLTDGYVCPPGDRSSFATAVGAAGGWVYRVEVRGFDGTTEQLASNNPASPMITNPEPLDDAGMVELLGGWATAVGDPTAYTLTMPGMGATPTTRPTPTTR